jgi:molecular chaperone DnaK (HSP70)
VEEVVAKGAAIIAAYPDIAVDCTPRTIAFEAMSEDGVVFYPKIFERGTHFPCTKIETDLLPSLTDEEDTVRKF